MTDTSIKPDPQRAERLRSLADDLDPGDVTDPNGTVHARQANQKEAADALRDYAKTFDPADDTPAPKPPAAPTDGVKP